MTAFHLEISSIIPDYAVDHERTQGFGTDRTRYIRQQKISLRWRDRDRNWPDIGMECQRDHAQNVCRRLL